MNRYDCIVVGGSNSGIISALSLLNDGYKVLLLDEHNNIGGLSRNIRKGRFNFETSVHNMYLKKGNERYSIDNIFKRCGVVDKVKYSSVPEVCRVITPEADFTLPFGIEEYVKKVNSLVPDSEASVRLFFDLAKECREAMDYIVDHVDNIDYEFVKEQYNNFMRISSYSVSKVLDAINMPLNAQEILNSMWIYFGSSEVEISFCEYAVFLLNIVEFGMQVPVLGNYDITMTLLNSFLERGGELHLNSKVIKLIIDDGVVNGVILSDGKMLYANKVIINSSLHNVYGKLINPEDVPREALKNINKRELNGKLFSVYLGLNRSEEELGLNNYSYLLYNSLDSDLEVSRMKKVMNGNQFAYVLNNANKDVSPDGTCVVVLNTLFYDDAFSDFVNGEKYYSDIQEIAQRLIETFQKRTTVRIIDYIEEVEIVSPIDNVLVNNCPQGATLGYKMIGLDNLVPRILNRKREQYVAGLRVCGGFDGDIYGYNSSFISGLDASLDVKLDIEGDING